MRKKPILMLTAAALSATILFSGCSSLYGTDSNLINALPDYNFSEMNFVQREEPKDGQPMATITTSMGEIKIVLYPDYAPNTVQNFINRANEGFYDNKPIYAVVENVYFITGANNADGTGGTTNDGQLIPNECSVDLWPFGGAVLGFSETQGYSDSRFVIVDRYELDETGINALRELKDDDGNQRLPDALIDELAKGSVAGLAGIYTVFGQTIEGLDVVKAITAIVTTEDNRYAPETTITIEKVVISEYHSS